VVSNILVIASRVVDFETDGKDGKPKERIRGARLFYCVPGMKQPQGVMGMPPNKAWLGIEKAGKLTTVPGAYEASFTMVSGEKGPELRLEDLNFLAPVDLDVSDVK